MRRLLAVLAAVVLLLALAGLPTAQARQGSRFHAGVTSRLGVIATESPAAARIGRAVLESGGNAIDAAAATVFALNVARPQSCGIGGGGFLVYRSRTGNVRTLDFREIAPAAIRPDQFQGNGIYKQFTGHTTVGVPGVVAGMDAALARYGTLSLPQAIAPAEQLARDGVRVTRRSRPAPGTTSCASGATPSRRRSSCRTASRCRPARRSASRRWRPTSAGSCRTARRRSTRARSRGGSSPRCRASSTPTSATRAC